MAKDKRHTSGTLPPNPRGGSYGPGDSTARQAPSEIDRSFTMLADELRQVRQAALELTRGLSRAYRGAVPQAARTASACPGGVCQPPGTAQAGAPGGGASAGGAMSTGGVGVSLGSALSGGLSRAVSQAVGGDFTAALRTMLSSVVRMFAQTAGRAMGGGIGGSLVSALIGGGLSALLSGLFRRRQRVQVDNTVRSEVLNFPRLSSLDLAANPASRLFGGRAVPRGAGFTVEVSYRGGAEDVVAAKVATKLAELNLNQGVV